MTVEDMSTLLDLTEKEVKDIEEEVQEIAEKIWFYNHCHMVE